MSNIRSSDGKGFLTSGENISYWIDSVKPLEFETLNKSIEADILIIGGGIAGLTTAYQLLRSGRNITLMEDGLIGSGESGRTTAHLTCALDDRYYEIQKAFGEEGSKIAAESHIAAINFIEQIIKQESIDCDFERIDGFLTQKLDNTYDLLIVGGEDHKTGQADAEAIPEDERYKALIDWTREHFPMAEELIYRWSGQVMEPVDHLAFIGKNPGDDNIYIITGDSGNGMTHGTIGAIIVSDLIQGMENKWAELYSPKRSPLKTPKTFFTEMFNMVRQYGDYITKADIGDVSELEPGQGAVLSKGFKRLAIYKDENNGIHAFSAVCPHMGCMVQWNAEEKSFDCPCHGSRFTKEGDVINGPATIGLAKVSVKE